LFPGKNYLNPSFKFLQKLTTPSMTLKSQNEPHVKLLSHNSENEDINHTVARLKSKIGQSPSTNSAIIEEQVNLIDQLAEFPLGIFLLQNRGTDGFWTDYMIQHQYEGRQSGCDPDGRKLTEFEKFLLDNFPLVVATQQRAVHFKSIIQQYVAEGSVLASLPCGLMRDLINLDFSGIENFKLVGIDLDQRSLELAARLAADSGLTQRVTFFQGDAWEQPFPEQFNLLTSNGLNVYEPNDQRVLHLYQNFYQSLFPGGALVTSTITPPPDVEPNSDWDISHINTDALRLQRILFSDVLQFNFAGLRSASKTEKQLKAVGFDQIEIIWDECRIFPTIVARKPH
jgi:SAM-dependent methyltransferase